MGRCNSAYGPTQCDCLIDPISDQDVAFRHSMQNDYHIELTRGKLGEIVKGRIPILESEEVDEFLSELDWLHVNQFVEHVKKMATQRAEISGWSH